MNELWYCGNCYNLPHWEVKPVEGCPVCGNAARRCMNPMGHARRIVAYVSPEETVDELTF